MIYYKIKSCCTGKKKDLPTKNDTKAKEVAKNPVVDNPEPSSESSDKSLWNKITSSKATFKFQSPIVIVDTPPAKTPSQNKWSKVLAQHSDSVTYTEEYDAPLSGDHDDLSCV